MTKIKLPVNNFIGTFGLIFVTIIWGGGYIATDIALDSMSPLQILTIRFLLAAILMGFAFIRKRIKINRSELLAGVILGTLLFMAFITQTIGLQYTTLSNNAFLTATNVVMVPFIASAIYKKRVKKSSIIGAILVVIGVGILSLDSNLKLAFGDILSLMCAVCFAFQIYLTGEYVKKYQALTLNTIQMTVAFTLSFLFLALTEGLQFNFTPGGFAGTFYLGIFSTALAYFIQTSSQKYTEETTAAVILSMESVFGTIFSIFLLHEEIHARMIIGCVVILGAVLISELGGQEEMIGTRYPYENLTESE